MLHRWPSKAPVERKDYGFDWTDLLDGDSVSTSEWTVEGDAIQEDGSIVVDNIHLVWLKGGALGDEAIVSNTVTTLAGRIFVRSAIVGVEPR
jgi:hypothetical protein